MPLRPVTFTVCRRKAAGYISIFPDMRSRALWLSMPCAWEAVHHKAAAVDPGMAEVHQGAAMAAVHPEEAEEVIPAALEAAVRLQEQHQAH